MIDIIATSVLIGGVLYYIIKYKLFFDTQRQTSAWNIILCTFLTIIVSAYAIYLRVGGHIDQRFITTSIVFSISGTAIDLISNVFPERGAWAAGTALAFLVKEVNHKRGSQSIEYHIGLGIVLTISCMIFISEIYKIMLPHKTVITPQQTFTKQSLPFHDNIAKLFKNGQYSSL